MFISIIDVRFSFRSFGNITETKEYKELVNKGIITNVIKTVECSSASIIDKSNGSPFIANNIDIGTKTYIHAARRKVGPFKAPLSINKNEKVELFVIDLDKAFSNLNLDVIEIAGIMYTAISNDAIGLLFTIYGFLKKIIKNCSSQISEDIAYMHIYFRYKLNKNKSITKDALKEAYDNFFKDFKIDENSTFNTFEEMIEKMFNFKLLKYNKDGSIYISKVIECSRIKQKIRRNIKGSKQH